MKIKQKVLITITFNFYKIEKSKKENSILYSSHVSFTTIPGYTITIYIMKYTRKQKSEKVKKKKKQKLGALPLEQFLSIGVCGCGGDFDDKARENIIRVMNMRVAFNNKRVTTLVTYGV